MSSVRSLLVTTDRAHGPRVGPRPDGAGGVAGAPGCPEVAQPSSLGPAPPATAARVHANPGAYRAAPSFYSG